MKNLCSKCNGFCCRYFAVPLDTPETRADFDDLRWYLAHQDVMIYVNDGEWFVQVMNVCRHLKKNRCAIYQNRPKICRQYQAGPCDFGKLPYEYDLVFKTDAEMAAYVAIRLDNERSHKRRARRGRS
jgi:Fe-S-cluster containining protein